MNDLRDKCVLIAGGTMGIGLATGLAFAREGCRVTLTHKWGTADEDEVRAGFAREGLPRPDILAADVTLAGDTDALLAHLRERHSSIEAFVSNVSTALVVRSVEDYSKRSLFKSLSTRWPLFSSRAGFARSSAAIRVTSSACRAAGPTSISRITTLSPPRRPSWK